MIKRMMMKHAPDSFFDSRLAISKWFFAYVVIFSLLSGGFAAEGGLVPDNGSLADVRSSKRVDMDSMQSTPSLDFTDRKQLWELYKSKSREEIHEFLKGNINLMEPMVPSEIQEIADVQLLLDFVEVKNLFPSAVMNLGIHEELAGLCGHANPLIKSLAKWYMAKLLKHFSVNYGDKLYETSQLLERGAREGFESLVANTETSASLKGLLYEYLENEEKALESFDEGAARGEAFSHYKLAQQKEFEGEEDSALSFYEMAFILGYEKALTDIGRLQDEEQSFLILKKAGERGSGEAYFLIAKMIREGFTPDGDSRDEAFWLEESVKLGSLSYSLGRLYEKRGDFDAAIRAYKYLCDKGDVGGFLEIGKIREKERNFTACENVYRDRKAGWSGLFALAEITPEKDKKMSLKKQASSMFITHFNRIIETAKSEE